MSPSAASRQAGSIIRRTLPRGGFPFPRKTTVVVAKEFAPGGKKVPGKPIHRPVYAHAGVVETVGHRAKNGRWIKARGVVGGPRWRSGNPARGQRRIYGWTHPKDRVKQWYIWKGDSVRLDVGKPEHKYNDPAKGASSGYKIYTVEGLDMTKNKVYLAELKGKRSVQTARQPDDYEDYTAEQKRAWNQNFAVGEVTRAVQMSNLSLLVEKDEDPSKHVWATRMTVSKPVWDRARMRWTWDRYATKVTRTPSTVEPEIVLRDNERIELEKAGKPVDKARLQHRENAWYKIPWPKGKDQELEESIEYQVKAEQHMVVSRSAERVEIEDILTIPQAPALIPATLHSAPPTDQSVADVYRLGGYEDPKSNSAVEALMPLYLSEELSPRFAKHTVNELYKLRLQQREESKKAYIEAAVQQWKDLGRDRFLREIMDSDEANLRGVPLKPRSEREIRQVAELEWKQVAERELYTVAKRLKKGYLWDYKAGGWISGPRAQRRENKNLAKLRKAQRLRVYLENLKLKQHKNMVVPAEARKEPKQIVVKPKRKIIRPGDLFGKYLRT